MKCESYIISYGGARLIWFYEDLALGIVGCEWEACDCGYC
jgi:hypothetical protein